MKEKEAEEYMQKMKQRGYLSALNDRELKIIKRLAAGRTLTEVADDLNMSRSGVTYVYEGAKALIDLAVSREMPRDRDVLPKRRLSDFLLCIQALDKMYDRC